MSTVITFIIDKIADLFVPKAGAASVHLFKGMSRRSRILLLTLAGVATLGLFFGHTVHLWIRVAGEASHIPLNSRTAATLRHTASQVNKRVISDLMDDASTSESAWNIAQALVAVDGVPPEELQTAFDALVTAVDSQCACWRSRNYAKHPPHLANTAWSLHAFASLGRTPPTNAVDTLLAAQHPSGAWPMHPGSEFGSTYATSLALLALQALVEQGVVEPRRQLRAKRAIAKGHDWLTGWRLPKQARWRDYPDLEAGEPLASISGLVLFTLHELEREDLRALDRLWLQSLPPRPPAWDVVDRSRDLRVTGKDGLSDAVNLPQWPWLVLGTVTAYRHGNLREQASAVRWLDNAVSASGLDEVQFTRERGAAEFLMALRVLIRDAV